MMSHLSWEVIDIIPAIAAMFVMCVAMFPFLVVATALASWHKRRRVTAKAQ